MLQGLTGDWAWMGGMCHGTEEAARGSSLLHQSLHEERLLRSHEVVMAKASTDGNQCLDLPKAKL